MLRNVASPGVYCSTCALLQNLIVDCPLLLLFFFVSSVFLVTAGGVAPSSFRAVTVASFSSVSLSPPIVSFSIKNPSRTNDLLRHTSYFSIHLLSERQAHYGQHFSTFHNLAAGNPFCRLDYSLSIPAAGIQDMTHKAHLEHETCPGSSVNTASSARSVRSADSSSEDDMQLCPELNIHGAIFSLHCKSYRPRTMILMPP